MQRHYDATDMHSLWNRVNGNGNCPFDAEKVKQMVTYWLRNFPEEARDFLTSLLFSGKSVEMGEIAEDLELKAENHPS